MNESVSGANRSVTKLCLRQTRISLHGPREMCTPIRELLVILRAYVSGACRAGQPVVLQLDSGRKEAHGD
jgi:hypothetical protein